MRILFLSDDFPPKAFGGAGIATHDLAVALHREGHELFIITTTQDKKGEGMRDLNGLKVYDIYTDYPSHLASFVSLHNFHAVAKVKRLIKKINPDIIHAHNIHHYLSYRCLNVARRHTNNVFLTAHDAMAFNYGKLIDFYDKNGLSIQKDFSYKIGFLQNIRTAKKRYNPFRNMVIRHYLNTYPRQVFAISDELKKALVQNGIKNCSTIHNGIDCSGWDVPVDDAQAFASKLGIQGKKVILFGGRLSEVKGGKIMIDALNEVLKKEQSAVLLIAGTSDGYGDYLMKYAESLNIRDHVVFTGWLSRADMKKAYEVADVVATPSIYFDPFNLFNIEAGAASKPVVGTCFGGTPEIVQDAITGRIVNPRNIPMMAEAMVSILKDPSYGKKLGAAGRKRVEEHFSLEGAAKEMLAWYI